MSKKKKQEDVQPPVVQVAAPIDTTIKPQALEHPGILAQPFDVNDRASRESVAEAGIDPAVVAAETPAPTSTPAATVEIPAPSINDQIKGTAGPAATPGMMAQGLANPKSTVAAPAVKMTEDNDPSDLDRNARSANLDSAVAAGTIDSVTAAEQMGKRRENAQDDLMSALQRSNAERAAELRATETGNERAARWVSAAEAVAGFTNTLGVAAGGAHQQYRQTGLDWMRQADASRRERIARVASMEDNLLLQKQRLEEMKAGNAIALTKARDDARVRDIQMKQQQAREKYYQALADKAAAETAAKRREAEAKEREAEAKLKNLEKQYEVLQSLINQRNAAAEASRTRANAYSSGVQNQNENRTAATESRAKVNESQVGVNNAREKYWNEKDPNYYAKMRGNTVTPGAGPVAPAQTEKQESKEEKKPKSATPSLDTIFGN